eukprot:scaffold336_cov384-Prasinococcus_capsulatus_cf.AAC.1
MLCCSAAQTDSRCSAAPDPWLHRDARAGAFASLVSPPAPHVVGSANGRLQGPQGPARARQRRPAGPGAAPDDSCSTPPPGRRRIVIDRRARRDARAGVAPRERHPSAV